LGVDFSSHVVIFYKNIHSGMGSGLACGYFVSYVAHSGKLWLCCSKCDIQRMWQSNRDELETSHGESLYIRKVETVQDPILRKLNPVHSLTPCFFKIHLNIVFPYMPVLPN